jgi:RNA polymerase sigma-70 factor (ECF subfamily)
VSGATFDRDEVRRLYEVHGPALLAYASAFLPDPSEAEDMLHQVFLELIRRRVAISSPGYLFRAVRNRVFNQIRDRSREVALEGEDAGAQWLESPSGSTETALALQSALGTVPEEQREVIVLRVWGQLTFEEIGGVVGISPNTAASRYRYGLAKLTEVWNGRT